MTGYDDGRIACTGSELIIRHYYFPAGAKHIPYAAIQEARRVKLGALAKWRIHGSGRLAYWFSFDPARPRKSEAFIIYLSASVKPVITPDDPGRVAAELTAGGVTVTSGPQTTLW